MLYETCVCLVLLLGPFFLCAIAALRLHTPQLLSIWLFAALISQLSPIIVGAIYTLLFQPRGDVHDHEVLAWSFGAACVVLLLNVLLQACLRVLVVVGLLRLQRIVRRANKRLHTIQLSGRCAICADALVSWGETHHPLLPLWLYVGVGFATTSALMGGFSVWAQLHHDALRHNNNNNNEAHTTTTTISELMDATTFVNHDVCPQLPQLRHAAIQTCFLVVAQCAWGVMMGVATMALMHRGFLTSVVEGCQLMILWPRLGDRHRRRCINQHQRDARNDDHHHHDGGSFAEGVELAIFPNDAINTHSPTTEKSAATPSCAVEDVRISASSNSLLPPSHSCEEDNDDDDDHDDTPHTGEDDVPPPTQREAEPNNTVVHVELNEVCGTNAHVSGNVAASSSPQTIIVVSVIVNGGDEDDDMDPVPPPNLKHRPDVALITLVAAVVLHLNFSGVALAHHGALEVGGVQRASRGCVFSLPLQMVLTTASVLWALWLVRVERLDHRRR